MAFRPCFETSVTESESSDSLSAFFRHHQRGAKESEFFKLTSQFEEFGLSDGTIILSTMDKIIVF